MDITPCAQYQGETAIGETMGRNETELRDNEDTLQQPTELFIIKKKKKATIRGILTEIFCNLGTKYKEV